MNAYHILKDFSQAPKRVLPLTVLLSSELNTSSPSSISQHIPNHRRLQTQELLKCLFVSYRNDIPECEQPAPPPFLFDGPVSILLKVNIYLICQFDS